MGCHGTKVFVFNLWFNDAWEMELDFTTDDEVTFVNSETLLQRSHISTCVYVYCNTRKIFVANVLLKNNSVAWWSGYYDFRSTR
jgi:hypothetical protein